MTDKSTYEELEKRIQKLEQVESELKQAKQRKELNGGVAVKRYLRMNS